MTRYKSPPGRGDRAGAPAAAGRVEVGTGPRTEQILPASVPNVKGVFICPRR